MKKKVHQSSDTSAGQQSADYVVGQVSGSLFQKNSGATGSLSALFTTAAPAAPLLFQTAPKPHQPSQMSTETKEQQKLSQKGQPCQKKPSKEKSAAEQKLENREISLQTADEEERGQESSLRNKRKAPVLSRENDAEHWVMKRQKLKVVKEEEALKRTRTLFVGNLPSSCTKKTIRSIFKDKGSIESIRFRSVVREDPSMSRKVAAIKRQVHPKKQSMNAYVVFKDEDSVTKALERNGMEIEKDFYIRVDRVTDSSSHDHKRSVFVGNLSFDLNELAFRRHFEQCGAVEGVRLVRDNNSGLGKGFGYVLYKSADSVQLALELDGSKLEGRAIRVKRSVKKEKQKSKTDSKPRPDKGPLKSPNKGPRQGKGAGGRQFTDQQKFTRKQQQQAKKSSTSFKGQMVDPSKKTKKKGSKKKVKPNKTVHI